MANYIFDMLLCGVIYVAMVYFIVRLIKIKNKKNRRNNSDDDDGGIEFYTEPDLDLPPGVSLPDSDPELRVKEDKLDGTLK